MFRLKLLGRLSLLDDHGISPPGVQQKRRLGLLALVAASGSRGLSRDQLQCFLWSEASAAQARHALDQLIYATRRSLGEDPFLSEGGILRLNESIVESDLRHFTEAARAGRLIEAADSYGGPLLDGFHLGDSVELESWIDTERARTAEQYSKVIEKLAAEARNRGDHAAASLWWQKLAAADPLSSRVAIEVIQSLAASGDTSRAIHYARSYQDRVRSELEVEPDGRIENLVRTFAPTSSAGSPRRTSAGRVPTQPILPIEQLSAKSDERDVAFTSRRLLVFGVIAAAFVVFFAILKGAGGEKLLIDSLSAARFTTSVHSAQARENYLKGVNTWSTRSKEGLDTAVIYFRRAIEIDPVYADAYAGLANAYVLLGYSGYRPADAMFPKAKAAALRAIQFDSTLSAPYAALGMELTGERNFNAAEVAFHTAIARDPNYATAHQWYGILLMILGRVPEAVDQTRRAAELDPLSLQIQNTYATFLSASGQYEAALRHYQKVAGEEPDSAWVRQNPWLLTNMASVYSENGQYENALRFAKRAVEIAPRHPRPLLSLASVYLAMNQRETAQHVFARADTLNEQYPAYRALMYLAEGNADSAFLWFDRVKEWGIPILVSLHTSREFNNLRDDPRRRLLFRRLGIP